MNNNNVVLFEPSDIWFSDFATAPVGSREPIALECIASFIAHKYNVKIIQQRNTLDDAIIDEILRENPFVVGFSVLTCNYNHSLALAKKIKLRRSSIKIVFGGYHPAANPNIVKEESIDFVIIGEGEQTFYELLNRLSSNETLDNIDGLVFFDSEIKISRVRKRLDFDKLPWPVRDQNILKGLRCFPLAYPAPNKQNYVAEITFSRGCPYGCHFCPANTIWGKEIKYRSAENLVSEIKFLQDKFNVDYLLFNDLSINVNSKKLLELCDLMIEENINIKWFARANIGIKTEVAERMKEAGCTRIGFGIETINADSLKKIKPTQNLDAVQETLELTDSLGILNRGYFMIGYPWETEFSLQELANQAKNYLLDQIRVAFVTPFPGTVFFDQWRDKIIAKELEQFNEEEPVVKTIVEKEKLISYKQKIIKDFYSSQEYQNHCKEKIEKHPFLKDSFNFFFNNLHEGGII